MPVIGLLLSLIESPEFIIGQLQQNPALSVGEASGHWLPVAAEAEDDEGCRTLHDWISSLPGVAYVDVVHVNFEPTQPHSIVSQP